MTRTWKKTESGFRFMPLVILISAVLLSGGACSSVRSATQEEGGSEAGEYPKKLIDSPFELLHSQIPGTENAYRFLGAFPVREPAPELPREIAAFSGRWEGYMEGTPVAEDVKVALVVQEISRDGGTLIQSLYFDSQYPIFIDECRFRPVAGKPEVFEFDVIGRSMSGEVRGVMTIWLEADGRVMKGKAEMPGGWTDHFTLWRGRENPVYRDIRAHLASFGIQVRRAKDSEITSLADEYLVYLPGEYGREAEKRWPLILFFHGMGDIGENPEVMRKASPFRMILEKQHLPCIIVAPQLNYYSQPPEFRVSFMNAVLDEIVKEYQVDPDRIYLTGLSLGGHAAWRLAMARPDEIAALAPISAADPAFNLSAKLEGWSEFEDYGRISGIQVRVYHGAKDTVIGKDYAEQTFQAFRNAGGEGSFILYEDADHDAWTRTYLDAGFYEWLFSCSR